MGMRLGFNNLTLNIMLELTVVPVSVIDGVKKYRKSLRNATYVRSEEVQQRIRIRSRQQRVGGHSACTYYTVIIQILRMPKN